MAVKKEKASLSDGNVPFDEVRLVLNAIGAYHLFIYHAVLVRSGTNDITQPNQLRLMKEVIESRPCVGVDCEVIDKLGYLSVEVEEHKHPWRRVCSRVCTRLIKIDAPRSSEKMYPPKCRSCCRVQFTLARRLEHKNSLNEEDLATRQSVSSKFPICYLSPGSQTKRLKNIRESRKSMVRRERRYRKKFSVLLSDRHSSELDMLMERVESSPVGREELGKCVADAERLKPGTGALLRQVWNSDKANFQKDQRKNGKFKKNW